MNCGLLGRRLGHSYSPQIHSFLGDYPYRLYEREPEQLADFLKNGDFTGLNVTIPYKKDVIPFLDQLSPTAEKMGSVNTVVRRRDGTLYGHNTDYFGFTSLVKKSGIPVSGRKALVLGSGGTSNTAVRALTDLGAEVVVISRSGENNYRNLSRHADAGVIVNTTPVGMYPNTGAAPVDLRQFPRLAGVLEVIYNPARTQLLLDAEALGLPNANGLWMLVAQAKESAEYFTGAPIEDGVIARVYRALSRRMENIILVGMPGCGKTTVGERLAEVTGRPFVDIDREIGRQAGRSIPEIFAAEGEDAFRALETAALRQFGKGSGQILATGGGCVTREENYPPLHQNGTIVYLRRALELLPTQGRPLSQANSPENLYKVRKPLYERFADKVVDNMGSVEETVQTILRLLEE